MNKNIYIFVRHAESKKNLRDITGGKGEELTDVGRKQARYVAIKLKDSLDPEPVKIVSSNIIQAQQTAEIIADTLKVDYSISSELIPAGMGVINGLSKKQLEEEYPEYALQMKRWRSREIEAIELNIPHMESPIDFWNRISAYLQKLSNGSVNVIVCTRSIMVLAYNLAHLNSPKPGGGYKHMDIDNCDTIAFSTELDFTNLCIEKKYTTERLI